MKDADVREIAVEFVGVHAEADEVFVRGLEPVPVGSKHLAFGRNVLVDQDAGTAGGGAVRQEFFLQFGEREPGIQDVVDEQDMAALRIEFLDTADVDLARGRVVEVEN